MGGEEKVNILLVDDQPGKLLGYEVILTELGENLIKAGSANEALEQLLKNDVAVVLIDVCMPDLDGFELAAMIREHPRFQRTAIIFISAILLTDTDYLRGYQMGGVSSLVTISLAVDFIGSAQVGQWLTIESEVIKTGRTICFAQSLIKADDIVIARANGTFRVVPKTSPAS